MNRHGHCASNEKIRRIDLGIQCTINKSDNIVPDSITTKPNLCTDLAWDNFDINLETLSGANSIHHTYRICYQNVDEESCCMPKEVVLTGTERMIKDITKVPQAKAFEELHPYRKKPKMSQFEFENTRISSPGSYMAYKDLDTLWMVLFHRRAHVDRMEQSCAH